jgi:hypothetical protein
MDVGEKGRRKVRKEEDEEGLPLRHASRDTSLKQGRSTLGLEGEDGTLRSEDEGEANRRGDGTDGMNVMNVFADEGTTGRDRASPPEVGGYLAL